MRLYILCESMNPANMLLICIPPLDTLVNTKCKNHNNEQ